MNKKVCIFVDGENFRKSIVDIFKGEFDQEKYLPKTNWGRLYDQIAKDVTQGSYERVRTYWYVTQELDFYPYNFPDPENETEELRKILSKHEPYNKKLENLDRKDIIIKMKEILNDLLKEQEKIEKRFDGWITIQNGIQKDNESIEFRRAGSNSYNLFKRSFGFEKAVDVKLSVDLVLLRGIYDIAVIVSGDQDFVPAVQVVKDFGKKVVNVSFKTRGGELLPGGSRKLNIVTDGRLILEYDTLKNLLGLGTQSLLP